MTNILFLVHRIPYPPDKGDKIRSWNMLKHLLANHDVHLGCFVDDPEDMTHIGALAERVADLKAIPLNPKRARIASAAGFLTGEPLTVRYYRSAEMSRWVDATMKTEKIDAIIAFSSSMAQFALPYAGSSAGQVPVIMDFVDMDSDKWAQYAKSKSWPASWLYNREARALAAYEAKVADAFDHSLFVTDDEVALFKANNPSVADKVLAVQNGVDTEYFDPALNFSCPEGLSTRSFVFTGAMDYWANVDAVQWFADEVWPRVREALPDATFVIVGSKPTAQVEALASRDGISVTGRVPDVRPYLAHACSIIAPLRIARGVQNKVLEGMAMAMPVVASPQGFEGIRAEPGRDLYVEERPEAYADRLVALARSDGGSGGDKEMGARARQVVIDNYSWAAHLATLDGLTGGVRDD